jgi:TPR repeat protein
MVMKQWLEQIKVALLHDEPLAFENLSFEKPWTKLTAKEREQLAEEMIHEGTKCIDRLGLDHKAIRFFDLASAMAPVSSQTFLLQGSAFYQKAKNTRKHTWICRAIERFQQAVELAHQPGNENFLLAKAYFLSYEILPNVPTLELAMQTAQEIDQLKLETIQLAELKAFLGRLWRYYSVHSQEPSDIQKAIEYLKQVNSESLNSQVQIDLGHCYIAFSKALGNIEWLHAGLKCFESLLHTEDCKPSIVLAIAQTSYDLYLQSGHRYLAKKAYECFNLLFTKEKPSQITIIQYNLITLTLAELEHDESYMKLFLSHNDSVVDSDDNEKQLWAWHYQYLNAHFQTNIDKIRALEKSIKNRAIDYENSTHYWLIYGLCRLESAEYFREIGDLFEAIDAFQKGLSLDHDRPALWLQLAKGYMLFADMQQESEAIKKATQLYAMAVICGRFSEKFWLDWAIAFFRLADATGDKGFLSDALIRFEKAFQIINRDQLPKNLKLMYYYGSALDFLGDLQQDDEYYERACQILNEVVRIDPNYSEARCALAVALTHYGESTSSESSLTQANVIFNELCHLDHEDEYLWNEWGVCLLSLYRLGLEQPIKNSSSDLLEQAIYKLQKAISLGNYHALYNMACAYAIGCDLSKALHYLKQAFEVGIHPPLADMLEDEWLDPLKKAEGFQELLDERKKEMGDEDHNFNEEDDPEDPSDLTSP